MTTQLRWTITGLVAVIALMVALWPTGTSTPGDTGTTAQRVAGSTPPSGASESQTATPDAARAAARLQECPAPGGGTPLGPLAGVLVTCLGHPGAADLGAALNGRTVVLNLWASWCGPCRREMPALVLYAAQPGAATVLGVNVQDDPAAAVALMADLGVQYPSVIDTSGAVQAALRAPAVLPVTFVVHPSGRADRVSAPPTFADPDQVRGAVDRDLAEHGR